MNGTSSAGIIPQPGRITNATVTDDTLAVDLEDGRTISVPIGWYPRLGNAAAHERTNFQISGPCRTEVGDSTFHFLVPMHPGT